MTLTLTHPATPAPPPPSPPLSLPSVSLTHSFLDTPTHSFPRSLAPSLPPFLSTTEPRNRQLGMEGA